MFYLQMHGVDKLMMVQQILATVLECVGNQ